MRSMSKSSSHTLLLKKVLASAQNLAFNSLLFFYRQVLNKEIGKIKGVVRAKKRPSIPVVLSKAEINEKFGFIDPQYLLIIKLLYGGGLRFFECLNPDAGLLTIHDGQGQKDTTVPIPNVLQKDLRNHLQVIKQLHHKDLEKGYGVVFWSMQLIKNIRMQAVNLYGNGCSLPSN